ncbi:hypothetical protein BH23GEM10_BH23GEM10_07620 [soil metagenome]
MHRTCCSFAAWLAILTSASGLAAQVVQGRVVEAGAPVAGVHVLLLDADARPITSRLTGPEGRFVFQLYGVRGRYSIVAEMIGRQSTTIGPFAVGEGTTDHLMVLQPQPVRLEGLRAETARRCHSRPLPGHETHTVWEEARKALAVEELTRRSLRYRYDIRSFVRELDPFAMHITHEESRYRHSYTGVPFRARSAPWLIEHGWVERDAQGTLLYGPTAELLLSEAFLDLYCFHLVRDEARAGQIGLSFQPIPGRTVPDIKGVLWLDEATAELRVLEFGYVHLPPDLPLGNRGGQVVYSRLATGAWFINEWAIRSPRVVLYSDPSGSEYRQTQRVTGYREDGAQVLRITARDGTTLFERQRDTLGTSHPQARRSHAALDTVVVSAWMRGGSSGPFLREIHSLRAASARLRSP